MTEEQERYILAHINDRPRTETARKAGVSLSTVYRLVRLHGGEIRREWSARNLAVEEAVRRGYPLKSSRELAAELGLAKSTVLSIAKELSLRHTPETEERLRRKTEECLRRGQEHVDRGANARKCRAKRRLDEWRVMEGKPQQTRFRLKRITQRAYKAKWSLMRRFGYREDPDDPYTLLYTREQRRSSREGEMNEKYKLKFEFYEE